MDLELPKVLQLHLDGQKFDHAYLFLGPKGVRKNDTAELFIEQIFSTTGWSKEILTFDFAETSTIDELRELIKKISLTGSGTGKRVVLFQNFEQASNSATSALLKTIEEPAQSNIIILLANAAKVMPTIMSRCTVIRFSGLAGSQQELTEDLALGFNQLKSALQGGLAERMLSIPKLSELETNQLTEIISHWLISQKLMLSTAPKAVVNCRTAQETIYALQTNRNIKLVLQDFFLKTKI